MKKISMLILVVLLAFSLVACQPETVQETQSMNIEEPKPEVVSLESTVLKTVKDMPEHVYKISHTDFIDKVKKGDDMIILDIRTAADYEAGHIKGAISVPWGTAIAETLNKIDPSKEVFVYCYTGQTAGQAVFTYNVAGIPARSVHLGFKLGISKVEGFEDVMETTPNVFGDATFPVEEVLQAAITEYYAGLAAVKDTKYATYKVSEDDLKALIDSEDDSIFILSVRSAADFAKAHIQGAVNIPFGKTTLDDLSTLPKDKTIIVYCYTGQTAGQTTAALRLLGYDAVSLNGGMGAGANAPMGWLNKGFLVVSESAVFNAVMDYFATMPEHVYKISHTDFVEGVKNSADVMILDMRSADDYAKGHAIGAISVPFGTAISDNLVKMTQDKEVWVYCYSGQTAGQAVVTLNIAGVSARSVHLGWNFGISKVEGYDAIVTTEETTFGDTVYAVNEEIAEAVAMYYEGLAEVKDTPFALYKVPEDHLNDMIEMAEDFYLLSARSAEDYAKGHIKGAKNVPFNAQMMNGLAGVPKDKKVVVYCYTGQTAGQAVAAMRLIGYDAVSLNGGTGTPANAPHGWTNKGYELVLD